MIFLINNSTQYFFPIFLINYKIDSDFLETFILLIELGGYILEVFLTLLGCYVIYTTRAFHWNLNMCICGCFYQWFEMLIGRLIVMPYHKGWIVLEGNDPKKIYFDFYASDISEMPKIVTFWNYPFLFIGMIFISHYYVMGSLALTCLTVERSCATFWINDYETKLRPQIFFIIFSCFQIFSGFVVLSGVTLSFNIYYWILIGILVLILTLLLFLYIWYWNIKIHKILIVEIPKNYLLQARFQAKENARSLNLLKYLMIIVGFCIFPKLFQSLITIFQWTNIFKNYEILIFAIFEFLKSQNPCLLIPLAMCSVPKWRNRFFKLLNFIPIFKQFSENSGITVVHVKPIETVASETDEYFQQLKSAWA